MNNMVHLLLTVQADSLDVIARDIPFTTGLYELCVHVYTRTYKNEKVSIYYVDFKTTCYMCISFLYTIIQNRCHPTNRPTEHSEHFRVMSYTMKDNSRYHNQ